jgi:hypothetical protein
VWAERRMCVKPGGTYSDHKMMKEETSYLRTHVLNPPPGEVPHIQVSLGRLFSLSVWLWSASRCCASPLCLGTTPLRLTPLSPRALTGFRTRGLALLDSPGAACVAWPDVPAFYPPLTPATGWHLPPARLLLSHSHR